VEAPTVGSVILAGILLKLSGYGLYRFVLGTFYNSTVFFTPLIYTISLLGIIYVSAITLRQIDLKKIIAYASIAHMNYVTLGIVTANLYAITGSIFLMLGHGLVSSALFFCVGFLYDRYRSRLIFYYQGLIFVYPCLSFFFFFFLLANTSFPGTINFVEEFLVLPGVFSK
jgi:NADH:ubiquinone oxidoreductase subunit 4 (subunit M)